MTPAEILLRTSIFRDLRQEDLEELLPWVRQQVFARGDALWNEGDRSECLYVVVSGQVKTFRVSSTGDELIVQISTAGELVGTQGVFHPSGVRLMNVHAMFPTVCLTIEREALLVFFARHATAMRRMFEALSESNWKAGHALVELAFEDIRRRVARTLLELADAQGEPTTSGLRIPVKLSQATLARMVAASRENVNRVLAPLLAKGALSQREGFFFVHERAALEEVAGGPSADR